MRCVFIRYNPDAFKIGTKTKKVSETKRHTVLLETIRKHMKPSDEPLETNDVIYLFYDGADTREDVLQ